VTVVASRAWLTIMAPLARRAIWLIVVSWLLFVLAAFAAFGLFMSSGLLATYNPQHPNLPIARAEVHVALAATAIGLLGTMSATLAITRGQRMEAAVIVLACWSAVLLGGALYVGLTPHGLLSHGRYAGDQLFRVPWQFRPRGADSPSRAGFFAVLCLESLRGGADGACERRSTLTVRPAENGFESWDERIWQWRSRLNQITMRGARDGYRLSDTPDGHYARHSDADGSLISMVICDRGGCRRQFLSGTLVIDYSLPRADYPHENTPSNLDLSSFDDLDRKLAALVESWRAR
jgi:hypothetical protein